MFDCEYIDIIISQYIIWEEGDKMSNYILIKFNERKKNDIFKIVYFVVKFIHWNVILPFNKSKFETERYNILAYVI